MSDWNPRAVTDASGDFHCRTDVVDKHRVQLLFASEHEGVIPDMMVLCKGLIGCIFRLLLL